MSVFNRSTALDAWARGTALGRQIFVDAVGGNDTTGDGSRSFPYASIARGAQDVRTGQFDTVFVRRTGTSLAPSVQAQVNMNAINDFAIVGMGVNWLGQVAGAAGGMKTISALTIAGGALRVDTSAAHGYTAGDSIFFRGVAQSGTVRINGPAYINSIDSPTRFRCTPQNIGTLADQPYTGGALGNCEIANFSFRGCSNVLVYNMSFSGAVLTANAWGGIVFFSTTNAPSSNNLISNCGISNASLGYLIPSTLDLDFTGANLQVERCRFSPSLLTLLSPLCDFSQLYLGGAKTWVINENVFASLVIGAPNLYPGAIRHTAPPGVGAVLVNNQWDDSIPATARVFADDPTDLENVFYRRNFFAAGFTVPEQMDAAGDVSDPEPAEFIGQDFLNTHSDLIWRQPIVTAIAEADSMGELVARSIYRGEVHIDTVNGSSGTQLGVNGTPDNPSDNLTDARTIADALGITSYAFANALTIGTDHLGWSIRGKTNPELDVLTLSGGPDVTGSNFTRVTLTGQSNGEIVAVESIIDNLTEVNGIFLTSLFRNTVSMPSAGGAELLTLLCAALPLATVSLAGGASNLFGGASLAGSWTVTNASNVGVVGLSFAGGTLTLAASCTSGLANIGGIAPVTDNSGAGFVVQINALSRPVIADDVWDEALAGHVVAGSGGGVLQQVLDLLECTTEIVTGIDPWRERWTRQSDSTVLQEFELFDEGLNAINDGNPIQGKYVRRRVRQ